MFNYRQNGPFQTPTARRPTMRGLERGPGPLRSIQEDQTAMKPSKLRSQRRFGTNLTNKKAVSRISHSLSKTQQIYKGPKRMEFASRIPLAPQSSLRCDVRPLNEQKSEFEEPEYCPKGTSWRPALNRKLHRIVQRAFKAISGFKLFVASGDTHRDMDCVIPHRFDLVEEPQRGMALAFLYQDTDSEDTDDEHLAGCGRMGGGNCHLDLADDEPVLEVYLQSPLFV